MIKVTDKQYWMDGYLKSNLDSVDYNLSNDWDFVWIISGDGMVRVGKSMLAQQIGYYISWKKKTPFSMDNEVFSGEELIKVAHKLPKNSVIIYDESRGELDCKKTIEKISKVLLDFFAECGIYNHFILLVLPDYFEMNKTLAINRSAALINVFKTNEQTKNKDNEDVINYKRGHWELYGPKTKKKLYIKGKKDFNSYEVVKADAFGTYPNYWVLDQKEYEKKKREFIQRERDMEKAPTNRFKIQRDCLMWLMHHKYKISQTDIAEMFNKFGIKISRNSINISINSYEGVNEVCKLSKSKSNNIYTPKRKALRREI